VDTAASMPLAWFSCRSYGEFACATGQEAVAGLAFACAAAFAVAVLHRKCAGWLLFFTLALCAFAVQTLAGPLPRLVMAGGTHVFLTACAVKSVACSLGHGYVVRACVDMHSQSVLL
jgi:hypothetical protein